MAGKRKYDRAAIVPEICERLAKGEPLAAICRDKHMPDPSVVWDWSREDEIIAQAIARAREEGFDALAAECLEIADDPTKDYREGKHGELLVDSDHIQRSKLRIETRLKLLAKWDPKRYGDKLEVGGSGKDGAILIQAITGVPSADAAD